MPGEPTMPAGRHGYEYFPQGWINVYIVCASGYKRILQYPSNAVANVNPFNYCRTVLAFGIRNSVHMIYLFVSLQSVKKHTVVFDFGIIKDGDSNSDSDCLLGTPISTSCVTSFWRLPSGYEWLETTYRYMALYLTVGETQRGLFGNLPKCHQVVHCSFKIKQAI